MRSTHRHRQKALALSMLASGLLSAAALSPCAAATTSVVKGGVVRAPVPPSLKAVESAAEDLVDSALSHNRAEVVAESANLRAAGSAAAGPLTRSGIPSPQVAQLRRRTNRVAQLARGGSFISIALGANAVSGFMPTLYGRFHDRVPAAVLALDYLDREAQLRSLNRQPEKVSMAVATLVRTWARLRPKVITAGGAKEAAAYDKHVAAMKRLLGRASKTVQAEAVHGLNLVDRLEQVFLR